MIEYAIASAALSFMGSMSAAKAAKREAALRARQIETQKKQARLQALQEHNIRLENLNAFLGMNEAFSGTMGRDLGTDRSLKRLMEKAKENTAVDVNRARVQLSMEQAQRSFQQNMALEKGRNIARGYRYQALGSLVSAGYKASTLSTPSSSTNMGNVT
tara:strand:+ start:130 stop:606 length:477 start_codon:yes stop_codon:yes gene_type:complete